MDTSVPTDSEGLGALSEKIKLELVRFRKLDVTEQDSDPTGWWKMTGQFSFPLLAKFWASYGPFQATSVAAER